jgi:hypothetical protein
VELGSTSASVALPSADQEPSHIHTTIRVGTGGRLHRSPGGGPASNAGARVLQQTPVVRPDLWWRHGTHNVPAQVPAPGSCLLPLERGPALLISVLTDNVEEAGRISATGLAAAGLRTVLRGTVLPIGTVSYGPGRVRPG